MLLARLMRRPVLFCSLAFVVVVVVVVVCNAAAGRAGRPPCAWAVAWPTLFLADTARIKAPWHGRPVQLRPVRATPCFTNDGWMMLTIRIPVLFYKVNI